MRIWDSESDSVSHSVTEDCMYIAFDAANGVLRLADYEVNGMHTTSMLFVGPDADQNAAKFDAAVDAEGEEGLCVNVDTVELIHKCFGLRS
jgi:hypothetical protein